MPLLYLHQMVQSNQVLQTNGSGTVSWASQASSGMSIFTYSIGGTTTSITGNDDSSNSLLYTAGSEQVFLNGVKLIDGGTDYTATNSSTITLEENAIIR